MGAPAGRADTVITMATPSALDRSGPVRLRRGRSGRRGTQILEFALLLPLFLFMLLFSIDMGRMVLISGAVHDAAFVAARAGAQVGDTGPNPGGASARAFASAVEIVPGAEQSRASVLEVSGACQEPYNLNVRVKVSYRVQFITPGLTTLLGMVNGERRAPEGDWILPAVGIARCEVVRG